MIQTFGNFWLRQWRKNLTNSCFLDSYFAFSIMCILLIVCRIVSTAKPALAAYPELVGLKLNPQIRIKKPGITLWRWGWELDHCQSGEVNRNSLFPDLLFKYRKRLYLKEDCQFNQRT